MRTYTGPTYDIDLDQPPRERWAEFAQDEAESIHEILGDVETCIHEELSPYLCAPLRAALTTLATGGGWVLRQIVNQFGEEYTEELAGIAQHAEVPVGKLMLGNLIYDFTSLAEMYGCGCSSASFEVDGSPVLVRNMDWVVPRSTGRHTKVIRFHRGNKHYTSVGVAGVVGVLSAYTDQWAVTVNQAPVVNSLSTLSGWLSAPTLLFKWPALQRVRAVCDRLPSYNGLVLGLRSTETIVPFFAHAIGSKTKEHTVVTHVGGTSTIRTKRHNLVQTNHYVSGKYAKYNPKNGDDWEWDTYGRYSDLKSELTIALENNLAEVVKERGLSAALNLLRCVTGEDTMQQMALWPAQAQMLLKTRNKG